MLVVQVPRKPFLRKGNPSLHQVKFKTYCFEDVFLSSEETLLSLVQCPILTTVDEVPESFEIQFEDCLRKVPDWVEKGACYRAAPGSPTTLVHGDNRSARLIPTPERHVLHHPEAMNHLSTFTLKVCLCPYPTTLLFTQIVCDSDVGGEPKQLMLFPEDSCLFLRCD
ncbi:hypothetical protein TNCV_431301 [Trichonephila clavipes]|nr:hypothetical protein TNCV_431301 [Trichonephila clavipes]